MLHSRQESGEVFQVLEEPNLRRFLSTVSLTRPSRDLISW